MTDTLEIALDDQALFDCVVYAGASSWSWYLRFEPDDDLLTLTLTMDNGEDGRESAKLDCASFRRAIAGCIEKFPPGSTAGMAGIDWSDPECDSDVDAGIADCILQFAVLGDVVFG